MLKRLLLESWKDMPYVTLPCQQRDQLVIFDTLNLVFNAVHVLKRLLPGPWKDIT